MPLWKTLLLNLYYYGSQPRRWWSARCRALDGQTPLVVLFYHRVADDRANPWTCSNRVFERQVRWLASRFEMISLAEVQRRLRCGQNSRPAVHLTFDDGYSENCHRAIPLLVKMQIPCTYFVTVKNVLDGAPFSHDVAGGRGFPPNTVDQLRSMAAAGVEIGAHTYSHPDLGKASDPRQLYEEVVAAGAELATAVRRPVRYFAFPFGQYVNLNSGVFRLAREAGYEAVCSAYGGYNFPGADPFHVQRIHADDSMVRLKNHATVDPRKTDVPVFRYQPLVPATREASHA
jgi:peptidoglycan/xylan/chitin deacetylase (PgdA/CDA1 family)